MKNKVTFFFRLLTCLTSNGLTVGMFGHTPGLVTCPYVTEEKYRGITKRTATERSIVRTYRRPMSHGINYEASHALVSIYMYIQCMSIGAPGGGITSGQSVIILYISMMNQLIVHFLLIFLGELLYGNLTKNMKKGWKKNLKHLMQQI